MNMVNIATNINFKIIKSDADIEILAKLAEEIWHEYWDKLISKPQTDYMIGQFQSFSAIKKQIKEGYIYKIANSNNKNAAYFGICAKEEQINYLFLSKLYVKAEYRNQGLGRTIFKEIITIAESLKLDKIRLTVNKYNTNTIGTYQKWGFEIIDSIVKDIGQGFVMDDYIMEYAI